VVRGKERYAMSEGKNPLLSDSPAIGLVDPVQWRWDVFGDGMTMIVISPYLKPTLWRRFISRFVLGSKWTKLDNTNV
jgi:hypothetical protein